MTRGEAVLFYMNLVGVVGQNLSEENQQTFTVQAMEAAVALGITVEERLASAIYLRNQVSVAT